MITRKLFSAVICILLFGSFFLSPQGSTFASTSIADQHSITPPPSQENPSSSNKKFDKKDLPRVVQYTNTHEKKNLVPVSQKGRPTPTPTPTNDYYVQPILFIASDLVENSKNSNAITTTFQMINRWYSGALEQNNSGYSYRLANTIVYHAPHPFSYYKCPAHELVCGTYDGIWGNIQIELMNAGYPIWDPGTTYIAFVKGAGGWAGASNSNRTSNSPAPGPAAVGGFGILGDWALDAITGTTNQECFTYMGSACYRDPQRGAVGHELGHTFGLAHAMELPGSLMYSWWDFPYDTLFGDPGNDEKSVLRNDSKFFLPQTCNPDAFSEQITPPVRVASGSQFTSTFKVTNYGFCHWDSTSAAIQLVSTNVWGITKQSLSEDTYPAQTATFTILQTAPYLSKSATYDNYWQMAISSNTFGSKIGNRITVTK